MEQYQALRMMLSDIVVRSPRNQTEFREKLATARTDIRLMEDLVGEVFGQGVDERARVRFNQSLNNIQSDLEELASAMGFGDVQGETR